MGKWFGAIFLSIVGWMGASFFAGLLTLFLRSPVEQKIIDYKSEGLPVPQELQSQFDQLIALGLLSPILGIILVYFILVKLLGMNAKKTLIVLSIVWVPFILFQLSALFFK